MDRAQGKLTQRGQIIGMWEAGHRVAEIATMMGLSKPTVRRWIGRWQESGNLLDRPRCGAPKKTTPDEDQLIANEVRNNPLTNASALQETLHLDISTDTIRRRLHAAGIHHHPPATKPKLQERHREARLQFALQHVEDDLAYWGRVIFSDEKTFASTTHGKLHCWRPDGTRYARKNIYEVARSGHVTANVWGWIHLYGVGELAEIHGRFNSEQYIEILEEVMLPTVRQYALPYPEQIIFMQVSCIQLHVCSVIQ